MKTTEAIRNEATAAHLDKIEKFIQLTGQVQVKMKETSEVIRQVCTITDFRDKLALPTQDHLDAANGLTCTAATSMIEVMERHLKDLQDKA